MSQKWSHGYFTEIEYTRGIYREMTPVAMRHALLVCGQVAPHPDQFRFAELGCGHGLTSLAVAALHPDCEVVAIDINPGQIAGARALADAAGLTNIRFEEWSFADLLNSDIGQFDYITAHGILSWVGTEQHREISEIFAHKLVPGGIGYVSYNALPGWAPMLPIRRVMQEHAKRSSRPAIERVREATDFVLRLQNANAAVFAATPTLKDRLDKMGSLAPAYLAHEYLNEHWIPFAFPEVVDMLATAKLTFAGSASPSEHFDITTIVPAAREIMKDLEDPIFYETVRDMFINQAFRKDLFVKGARRATVVDQNRQFGELRFVAQQSPDTKPSKYASPLGNIDLKPEIYDPLADILAEKPISVSELRERKEMKGLPVAQLGQALSILVGQGYAAPCLSANATERAASNATAVNQVLLDRARSTPDIGFLMSPIIGSGIPVDSIEQLFILHDGTVNTRVRATLGDLVASGRSLQKDGKVVKDRAEMEIQLRTMAERFDSHRRPVLKNLGVL
ncbi:methyltransferase regulatory domain-containing protein [Labrenzia sp. R4_2]|uniref:methyltransferase regulatory domain-containing protein n=1 Tax=Labrenzia sp. R4_2 TaxID=2821107 RepID=UPI001ADCB82F|nr:methyltransferase regulatory domain-containing protein [Labrenzia sp. R4_2]MBO9422745.1 methyltransferase regulatory domain-containing protein [Labrenzia sp. R4_2]